MIAADLAVHDASLEFIYTDLHETYTLDAEDAFETAVRAKRGGGLTKDAVYLDGLERLLAHLSTGAPIASLMCGKFALEHLPAIEELAEEGLVVPAEVLPPHLVDPMALSRLERARNTPIEALYQSTPRPVAHFESEATL